ncbi:hypothetical protein M8J76_014158 [Diaphorina citri]|nr:hypothetical protein M8J75_016042 [Diaphorina citri]KAI5745785.1 hypothetical protein M8J76_014158 [Diaphorina citri]KAI5751407.1 hypothetical protein M8J77_007186 [Diaphorina citri]
MNVLLMSMLLLLAVHSSKTHILQPPVIPNHISGPDSDSIEFPLFVNENKPKSVDGTDITGNSFENLELKTQAVQSTDAPLKKYFDHTTRRTSTSSKVQNIMQVVKLGLISSFDECARIFTDTKYSLKLTKKAILDMNSAFIETWRGVQSSCFHFDFFDCVKDITNTQLKNFQLEEQFYLLKTEILDIVIQLGKCGNQIIGRL